MGFFGKKGENEEEMDINPQIEEPEDELTECAECGEATKELDDDGYCKKCAEKNVLKLKWKEIYNYKFVMTFLSDDEGNGQDDYEIIEISKEDAVKCYNLVKDALFAKKDYVEIPPMECLDNNDDLYITPPKLTYLGQGKIDEVYYERIKEEEDEE